MKVLVDKEFLEGGLELICDSIRLKTGGSGVLAFPVEIKQAVDSIETGGGGITPTGTKEITENGEGIDVTTYAAVDVNVPTGITPSGKKTITANGTGIDVAQYAEVDVNVPQGIVPSGTKQITANGTGIDVAQYAEVDVAVPTGITPTGKKTITANGDNIDVAANASVKVNVPTGITPSGTKRITQNGEGIDVTAYAQVDVAVPAGGTPVVNCKNSSADMINVSRTSTKVLAISGLNVGTGEKLVGLCLFNSTGDGSTAGDVNGMVLLQAGSGWIAYITGPMGAGFSTSFWTDITFQKYGETGGQLTIGGNLFNFLGAYNVYPIVATVQ